MLVYCDDDDDDDGYNEKSSKRRSNHAELRCITADDTRTINIIYAIRVRHDGGTKSILL